MFIVENENYTVAIKFINVWEQVKLKLPWS